MCFSATASFVASGVLGAIGVTSVLGAPSRKWLPLASIPLLFAMQQASEGLLWLTLVKAPFGKADTLVAQVFLFFALFVWPAFVPFALRSAEGETGRRRVLTVLAIVGFALGAYLMACSALRPSYACIAYDNLYYAVAIDLPIKAVAPVGYVTVIVLPFLVSSIKGTAYLATLTVLSFAAAAVLYRVGFASVWCFFAAVLSGAVVALIRASKLVSRATLSDRHHERYPARS